MSILHSSARPSGASRRSSALLSARCGPVVHRATTLFDTLQEVYEENEKEKKDEYLERVFF